MKKSVLFLAVALTVYVDCTSKEFFQTELLLDWTESMQACRQNLTELVTMQSEEEYQHFWSYINLYEGLYWIGLQFNSININNTWEWVNGNPTTYSHWAEPPTGAGCGAFNSSSDGWLIANCSYKLMSVCQAPYPVTGLTAVSVENTVSLSWSSPSQLYDVPHFFIITYSNSNSDDEGSINTTSNSIVFSNLRLGRQYVFKVCTTENNTFPWSQPTSISVYINPPPPGKILLHTVENDLVSLSWGNPVGMDEIPHSFNVSYSCSLWEHYGWTTTPSNSTTLSNMQMDCKYDFNVTTMQDNGGQSTPASISLYIIPPPPGEIILGALESNSVSLSWGRPVGMDDIPHSFIISYSNSLDHYNCTTSPSNSTTIFNMQLECMYIINVTTVQDNGGQSTPTSMSLYIALASGNGGGGSGNPAVGSGNGGGGSGNPEPSPPGEITVDFVVDDSVSLSWGNPVGMDGVQYSFNITYTCSFWGHSSSTSAPSNSTVISNLRPGSEYVFNITTVQDIGSQSTPASISLYTKPSSPGEIMIISVESDSVSLSWGNPVDMDEIPHNFNISYCSFWGHHGWTTALSNSITISNLRAGSEYIFNVTTMQDNGGQSTPTSMSLYLDPTPPGEISVDFVGSDSVSLSWGRPVSMDGVQYSFNITYSCAFWGHSGSTIAPSNSIVISTLNSGSEYVFNITTVQDTGSQSTPASISLYTKPIEKRLYLKFVCSSTEPFACENEKQAVQQEYEARLAEQLKGLYWKLNWKEKDVNECSDDTTFE